MNEYNLYFKLAYTCQSKRYRIHPDWTIQEFLEHVRTWARRDFDFNDNDIIDIIEAGNPNNVNGPDAEVAPAIQDDNTRVKDKFTSMSAFYVRRQT